MGRYPFIFYKSEYPKLFEAEKERIQEVLGKQIVIEHVGSTAVPGLGGSGSKNGRVKRGQYQERMHGHKAGNNKVANRNSKQRG